MPTKTEVWGLSLFLLTEINLIAFTYLISQNLVAPNLKHTIRFIVDLLNIFTWPVEIARLPFNLVHMFPFQPHLTQSRILFNLFSTLLPIILHLVSDSSLWMSRSLITQFLKYNDMWLSPYGFILLKFWRKFRMDCSIQFFKIISHVHIVLRNNDKQQQKVSNFTDLKSCVNMNNYKNML